MRNAIVLLVVSFVATLVLAQDRSQIRVIRSDINNGVVILTAQNGKLPLELQCNQGIASCKRLEPGTYTMVKLPRNRGMYVDCDNVEIFEAAADPETADRLGQYWLAAGK